MKKLIIAIFTIKALFLSSAYSYENYRLNQKEKEYFSDALSSLIAEDRIVTRREGLQNLFDALVDMEVDPNQGLAIEKCGYWCTIFELSISYGNVDHVKVFIDQDINLDEINDNGQNLVSTVIQSGSIDKLSLLIDHGLNVNINALNDESYFNSLEYIMDSLVCDGRNKMITHIFQNNIINNDEDVYIMPNCEYPELNIIKLMKENKIHIRLDQENMKEQICEAVSEDQVNKIDYITKKFGLEYMMNIDCNGVSLLMEAARWNCYNVAIYLAKSGFNSYENSIGTINDPSITENLHNKSYEEYSALDWARGENNIRLYKKLISIEKDKNKIKTHP